MKHQFPMAKGEAGFSLVAASVAIGKYRCMWNLLKRIFTRRVEIYTDGGSKKGVGTWAFLVVKRGKITIERSGRVLRAGALKMEIRASREAILALDRRTGATLYSDCRILIDAMLKTKGEQMHPGGLQNDWKDLAAIASQHKINWKWVRAHAGNPFNERCDELCVAARNNS